MNTIGDLKALLNSLPDDIEIEFLQTVDSDFAKKAFDYEHTIDVEYFDLVLGTNGNGKVLASIVAVGEDVSYNTRTCIINEVSQWLQDNGFESASKAIDCHWDL